ncbi:hypothetical protein B0H67DRAFT_647076 [Lasiosphaeris hirsuta]|uniref:Uncharacterized protein n=1 Tax=Lasiosphaeris hirsuta TaxID=260670 RepID=A0AA40DSI5_9PEZI|nr:hypothetical protein B0H67DRAFT_647076 [Lasiosphaeris hirsuta]
MAAFYNFFTPHQIRTQNHQSKPPQNHLLTITEEQGRMIAEKIDAVLKYTPSAPDSFDQQFDLVARANDVAVKARVKDSFDAAATTNLLTTVSASAEELRRVSAAARKTEMESAAVAVVIPLVVGGLAGLAIWRLTGRNITNRLIPKVPARASRRGVRH